MDQLSIFTGGLSYLLFGNPMLTPLFGSVSKTPTKIKQRLLCPVLMQLKFLTGLASFGWIYQPFFSATWFEIIESTLHPPRLLVWFLSVKTWDSFFVPGNFTKKKTVCDLNFLLVEIYLFLSGWSCCPGNRFPPFKKGPQWFNCEVWRPGGCWSLRPLFKPRPLIFWWFQKKKHPERTYQLEASSVFMFFFKCFFFLGCFGFRHLSKH